jgi:tetratricopeptide (TPR) repeat protein
MQYGKLVKLWQSLGLLLFMGAFAITSVMAWQGGSGVHELRGRVATANGEPINIAVQVQLFSNGVPLAQAYTDSGGAFSFRGLKVGAYQLTITGDNRTFETTTVEAEIFFMSGNRVPQAVTRNITLLPRKDNKDLLSGDRELNVGIPKDAKKEFEKGVKSAKKGDLTEALAHWQKAIELHPRYYEAYLMMGEEQARQRNFPAAETALLQAVDCRPKTAAPHLSLGIVWVKMGEHQKALTEITQAMELGEKGVNAQLFLGVALMELQRFDEAEKSLLKAHDIGGATQPGLRLYLADFYNRAGKPTKTVEQLEAYLREVPSASNAKDIEQVIKQLKDKK